MASSAPGVEPGLPGMEIRFRLLFENSMDGILLTAPDGRVFDANASACSIFRRTREEICRAGRGGLMDTSDPRLAKALEERDRLGRTHAELRAYGPEGIAFPVEISSAIFCDEAGNKFTCTIVRDISARKAAEAERRQLMRQRTEALDQVSVLKGLLPVCAWCRKIRDEGDKWMELEAYIHEHSAAKFTHSICPECRKRFEER